MANWVLKGITDRDQDHRAIRDGAEAAAGVSPGRPLGAVAAF